MPRVCFVSATVLDHTVAGRTRRAQSPGIKNMELDSEQSEPFQDSGSEYLPSDEDDNGSSHRFVLNNS